MVEPALKQSRGCLGCCTKPPVIISMDEPSKVLRAQSQTVNKDNRSEDFWSTSTPDMDHSAAQSQRSISSIGISNNASDPQSSAGSQTGPEFVNHGKFAVICLLSVGSSVSVILYQRVL